MTTSFPSQYAQFVELNDRFERWRSEHRPQPRSVGGELVWFGKYKGHRFDQVYQRKGYVRWCLNSQRAHCHWVCLIYCRSLSLNLCSHLQYNKFLDLNNRYTAWLQSHRRPYRPRKRTELIRDVGDATGPWDNLKDGVSEEGYEEDGFVVRDTDDDDNTDDDSEDDDSEEVDEGSDFDPIEADRDPDDQAESEAGVTGGETDDGDQSVVGEAGTENGDEEDSDELDDIPIGMQFNKRSRGSSQNREDVVKKRPRLHGTENDSENEERGGNNLASKKVCICKWLFFSDANFMLAEAKV
jgi:hypothetical protein